MNTPRIKFVLSRKPDASEITVHGWVRTRRDAKNICFFELNDGSCLANLQIVLDRGGSVSDDDVRRLQTGASVEVSGVLADSPGSNQSVELHAQTIRVIGDSPADDYPLQKKRHSFEFLREIAHLRPRTNTFGAVSRVRNALSYAVHRFFQENGFLYIATPIITASDAEGAGEMFRVTTLPYEKIIATGAKVIDYSRDFFGKPAYLTVSGQLNAEIYACALERVYTFGPTFRAENSNTTRHLSEFWMIEPEVAFCDLSCNIDLAEAFLKYILSAALTECTADMEFFDLRIQKGIIDDLRAVIETKFARITYTDAIAELGGSGREFEYKPTWGVELQTEHEKFLTEHVVKGPVVVTDYPKDVKAFYMKQNDDGKTVRGMDVLVPRLGEIIGGSQREENLSVLENRIAELGLDRDAYWWYLELRKYGTVPHSGFGLGFERLIQYVTGMQNIRDVIPFPRAPGAADF